MANVSISIEKIRHSSNSGSYWATLSKSGQTGESQNVIVIEFIAPVSNIKELKLAYRAQQPVNNTRTSGSIYFDVQTESPYKTGYTKATASNNDGSVSWSGGTWLYEKTWDVDISYPSGLIAGTTYYIVVNSTSTLDFFVANTALAYVPPTYTVTVNKNTTAIATVTGSGTYTQGDKVTISASPKTGYHFTNWSGDSTSSSNPLTLTSSISRNYSVKANGAVNTGTIEYYANSTGVTAATGHTMNSSTGKSNTTTSVSYTDSTKDLYDVETLFYKKGYKAKSDAQAWRIGSSSATTYANQSSQSFSSYLDGASEHGSTIKLYANWTPRTYTVSYVLNGGSTTDSSTKPHTATYDSNYAVVASSTMVRQGYRFVGWTSNSDGTDDGHNWTSWSGKWTFVDGEYGIENGGLTLYAIWEPYIVTLIYHTGHTNWGFADSAKYNNTMLYDDIIKSEYWTVEGNNIPILSISNSALIMSKTGHILDTSRWSLTGDKSLCISPTTFSGIGDLLNACGVVWDGDCDETLHLYAIWTKETYTISYNTKGGTPTPSSHRKTFGEDAYITEDIPSLNGYEFLGWDIAYVASTVCYEPGDIYTIDSNITLYAVWKKIKTELVTGVFYKNNDEFKSGITFVKDADEWFPGHTVYFKTGGKWEIVQSLDE
jgi:hypothetical protein